MNRIRNILDAVYYALPVQLLIVQIRYHKFEMGIWLVLFLSLSGNFGEALGVPYLFLEPEYMGKTDFSSMFLSGVGMGTFMASFTISSYISDSYRFRFLALEYRPFLVFFMNNLLIPIGYLVFYSVCFIQFQSYVLGGFTWDVVLNLSGVYLGLFMVTVLIFVYFFNTNKNFVTKLGNKVVKDLKGQRVIISRARAGLGMRIRVDHFFLSPFKIRQVDPNRSPEFRVLVRTLNQNHGNALFFELIILLAILLVGRMESYPYFHVPAGMSIFLFLSLSLMLVSAFTFWFRKLGPVFVLLLVVGFFVIDSLDFQQNRHPALGMAYGVEPAKYTAESMAEWSSKENIQNDLLLTKSILERWKSDHQLYHGPYSKPKAVVLCVSGGGLRAAYFTVRILQKLDSLTDGRFMESTRLMTGASGGMIGAAYYRELSLLQRLDQADSIYQIKYARRMGMDLLNRVSAKMVTGIFLPSRKRQVGDNMYLDDRGWSFDEQLKANLGVFEGKRLGDYTSLEELAVIPMMIFTPVIVNDGRKLHISATNVSYLTRHLNYRGELDDAITGVEFRRAFREQEADSLQFVTALRMNATFPIINPYIRMPSDPVLQIIDAGVADNYGLETANRFLFHFSDWMIANTDGILVLQIRDSRSITTPDEQFQEKSTIRDLLDPIGGTYNAFSNSSDLENEDFLHSMDQNLRGNLDFERIYYEADSGGIRASLSWHLTPREIQGIEEVLEADRTLKTMERIQAWLEED